MSDTQQARRPLTKKASDAYDRSARYLISANYARETGNPDRAELLYEKSAHWLMVYNELTGDRT